MTVSKLLKEAEKAFHDMDWKKLAEINKKILAEKPDENIENLANGFYYYALARMEKNQDNVISDLEKAGEFFRSVDAHLASMADVEKLILLSGFDEGNRGRHLLDLAKLTQGLFIKSGDRTHLQLAIDSFTRAKPFFDGGEFSQIILALQFCHGTYARHSENPGEHYELVIGLCDEMTVKEGTTLACSKMNAANAHQNLAFINKQSSSIKTAIRLNEEAIDIFEQFNSKPEVTKAKQGLANVLRDASTLDTGDAEEHMMRAITLKKEVAEMFLEDGFDIDSGYEDLDIGIAYIELAACDQTHSDEHFESAIHYFDAAAKIFKKEQVAEGLGHAKAGIAAVHRSRGAFSDAAAMYEEAIAIFTEPLFIGRTKQNLAATYRDMARTTREDVHLKKAENLEREVAELGLHGGRHESSEISS